VEVTYRIHYHERVVKEDILALDATWRTKIQHAIETKITYRPEIFGKPLRKSLRGYRKLRVGDFRVIFRIEKDTVKILVIVHRSKAYKHLAR